jgi:hypothetical protein
MWNEHAAGSVVTDDPLHPRRLGAHQWRPLVELVVLVAVLTASLMALLQYLRA